MTKGAVQLGYFEKLVKNFIETAVGKGYEGKNPIMDRLTKTLDNIVAKERDLAKAANKAIMDHKAGMKIDTKFQNLVGEKKAPKPFVDIVAEQKSGIPEIGSPQIHKR